jgi:hypothetical protein
MHQIKSRTKNHDNALAKRLVAHWHHKFGAATLFDEPFQHFYSDNLWPVDIYHEILRLLPPHHVYRPMNIKEWVNAKGISTRDRCFLPEILDRMDSERSDFWHQIWLALTADSLKCLIFDKFKKDIALRLKISPDDSENFPAFVGISLTRDIEDYRIGPHPDGWPSVVTAQFYLPVDMSQQDLGTSFYGEVPVLQRPFLGRYKEIKRLPFVPNSGYAFVVNDLPGHRSLHGRDLIKPGSGVRNSILIRWSAEEKFRKRGREGISTTHQLS